MSEEFEIPKHASAGVAFLGAELGDAVIVLTGIFVGLLAFLKFGAMGFIGSVAAGFVLNKSYLDWREGLPAGQVRARLFRAGVFGYSNGFKGAEVLFVGDGTVINPASGELLERVEADLLRAELSVGPAKTSHRKAQKLAAARSASRPATSPLIEAEVRHGT